MERPWYAGPPCTTSQKCPKGHIDKQRTLSERNELALQHYHECAATGNFPDDDIVRRRAGLLRRLEKAQQHMAEQTTREFLTALVSHRLTP